MFFSLKLDTLSKEDLIKFAKKQMVAMQKIKSKCAGNLRTFSLMASFFICSSFEEYNMVAVFFSDLEKEMGVLRSPSDDTVIQVCAL